MSCDPLSISYKVTIYVDHVDDSTEFDLVQDFLARWGTAITVADCSTGGWEHCWNLLVPEAALKEIPEHWLCAREWAG